MKIALDGSDLVSQKLDGTTIYVRELLPRLARVLLERGIDVDVHVSATPVIDFPHGTNVITTPGKRFWTQTVLSRMLFRVRPNCLFLPIQTIPLYRPKNLRVVAVIHDLDFLDYPDMFTRNNRILLRWFTRAVARHATKMIAVSETTKQKIIQTYGRVASDIAVVHHGVNHELFRMPSSDAEYNQEITRVQKAYKVPPKHILFVGALQPRKNIQGLVAAFEQLREKGRKEHLVLVSGAGWQEDAIRSRINNSSARDAIHIVRKVPVTDIRALYWNASVFVLPSFAEGFGMPVLEAMACGTPTVVSDASALQEVAGNAARVASLERPESLCDEIFPILNNEELHDTLRKKGLARAAKFSWDTAAAKTAEIVIGAVV